MSATFRTTRWSIVARSRDADRATASKALGELCELYWYPLYAWLRRRGKGEHDARDLVQAFCAQLLERGGLDGASAAYGRFRSYLLGALQHFVHNEARHQQAQKRGGDVQTLSLDAMLEHAERRYAADPLDDASPERAFERGWALATIERAQQRLRDEYAQKNRLPLLDALAPALLGDADAPTHAAVATALQTSEGAVKVALHRLRGRLRELIRDEVAQTLDDQTLDDPDAIDDELQQLFAALRDGAAKSPTIR